jgi:hypothetical protein
LLDARVLVLDQPRRQFVADQLQLVDAMQEQFGQEHCHVGGAGLFDQAGVVGPAAIGNTVQAGDDGYRQRLFRAPQVVEVLVGRRDLVGLGEECERLGVAARGLLSRSPR